MAKFYTQTRLNVINRMMREKKPYKEIAEAIGTTEQRLMSRLSQLGIVREGRVGVANKSVRIPVEVLNMFTISARETKKPVTKLIRIALTNMVRRDLVSLLIHD